MKKMVFIICSFLIAYCLEIVALPTSLQAFRPYWVLSVLILWVIVPNSSITILKAWGIGLILDIITGTLMGVNAFIFVCITTLVIIYRPIIEKLILMQQTLIISLFFIIYELYLLWINGILGYTQPSTYHLFLPVISSIILWPWLYNLILEFCYIFHINLKSKT